MTFLTLALMGGALAQTALPSPAPSAPTRLDISAQATSLSTVRLDIDLSQWREQPPTAVLVAQPEIGGSHFVMGSSRLNDQPLPDPLVGAGNVLYWLLPGKLAAQGHAQLSYRLSYQGDLGPLPQTGLTAQLGDQWIRLSGQTDMLDYYGAQPLAAPQNQENAGAIKLPLDGSLVQSDQIGVTIEAPTGSSEVPTLNGEPLPNTKLGEKQPLPGGLERRRYYGLPIHAGLNTIQFGSESVSVRFAGPTTHYEAEPLSLLADGVTPIRLRIRALDEHNCPSEQPFVTVNSNLEPTRPDAREGEIGYQVALSGGEGILELQPSSTPKEVRLSVLGANKPSHFHFMLKPAGRTLGIGTFSATWGLRKNTALVTARAYFEGNVGSGKLYVAADSDDLPDATPNSERNITYGDASAVSVPLTASGPIAADYEHPQFSVAYRAAKLPSAVIPITQQWTALTLNTYGPARLSAFAAWLPQQFVQREVVTLNGTRLLRLSHGDIAPGSETLEVVTLDRLSGVQLSRQTLQRGTDYVLDEESGVITLASPLSATDGNLNTVTLLASYGLAHGGPRQLNGGAQLEVGDEHLGGGVAAVNIGDVTTYGARVHYRDAAQRGQFGVQYAGGWQANADYEASLPGDSASFSAATQSADYAGQNSLGTGTRIAGRLSHDLSERLSVNVSGHYQSGGAVEQGDISGLLLYKLKPWIVGGGLRYSSGNAPTLRTPLNDFPNAGNVLGSGSPAQYTSGWSVAGSLGYQNERLSALLTQNVPVSGDVRALTQATLSYKISPNTTLAFADAYDGYAGHNATLSLNAALGSSNVSLAYALPNASGAGNRASFGVGTAWQLNNQLSLGLQASDTHDFVSGDNTATTSLNLRYQNQRAVATLGSDLSYSAGLSAALRVGLSGDLSQHLSLSSAATAKFGKDSGAQLSFGYAYRNSPLSSLGYLRYLSGSLAGEAPQVRGGVSAEYSRSRWSMRGALDARMLLNDANSLTWQPQLGFNLQLAERFRVGAWGRAYLQTASHNNLYGYGLEAGVRPLPGAWLNVGYNFKGFEGLPTAGMYTEPGLYLRVDLTLDETLNGAHK